MSIPTQIQTNLIAKGITSDTPGWSMVNNARLLPPTPPQAQQGILTSTAGPRIMVQLMKAFYDYGRTHFTWSQSSPSAAGSGGLLKGGARNCACATFNLNLKKLAQACGLENINMERLEKQFITIPGGVCIDSNWPGNVKSDRDDYSKFRAFKFQSHYWLSYMGTQYDVCYNSTFQSRAQIVWTNLLPAAPQVLQRASMPSNKLYRLEKPLPAYNHLIMENQNGPQGWPVWKLVSM